MQDIFSNGFGDTLLRFAICILVNWAIVHFLYFKKSKRQDFYFTFMVISVAIYFLVYLMMGMDRGKATMGVGLGLFGIFSIMRYRTDSMPVREMTYLFVVICLSVVHAMADSLGIDVNGRLIGTPVMELVVIDVITILAITLLERYLKIENSKLVQYDRIELIKPEKRKELIADLELRLGIAVTDVKVGAIDFLRDMAVLRVYYTANGTEADEHTYSGKGKNVWRNRLQAKYKLGNLFRPYANVETYMSNGWDKIRYAVGTELRLNKQHAFDIKYMYQHPFGQDDTDGNRHILGLGYTYKF